MKMNIRIIGIGIVVMALILAILITANADPVSSGSNSAQGGSITSLDHTDVTTPTYNWAGYYGEVGGTLQLASGSNVMYSWSTAEVGGEVYASTGAPDWSNIVAETGADVDNGMEYLKDKSDSATITFSGINSADIVVGNKKIDLGTASATHTFVNGTTQSTVFEEAILTDGTNIVWTAIISPNAYGFEVGATTHDYQMIVPEDGSGNHTGTTTYNFYVELE